MLRLPVLEPCDQSIASSSSCRPKADTLEAELEAADCKLSPRLQLTISARGMHAVARRERRKGEGKGRLLADHVRAWVERKVAAGAGKRECELPFLTGAPKMVRGT